MEVHIAPELEAKIEKLTTQSGYPIEKLVEDALATYVDEFAATREMLDERYDDLKSGRVKSVPSDQVIARLREKSATRRSPAGA